MLHLRYRLTRVGEILQDTAGRIRRKVSSGVLILGYHRVIDVDRDPYSLTVSTRNFSEQLEVLRRHCTPVPLSRLVANLRAGKSERREVAITFDDGYIDNLRFAKPIMERHSFPGTVFIASGYLGLEREYWWDELERIFLTPGELPATLELSICGQPRQWTLGDACRYGAEEEARERRSNYSCDPRSSARLKFFAELHGVVRSLPSPDLAAVMTQLAAWAGIDRRPRPNYRPMTSDEVRELESGGLVRVGAHTVTHPDMSRLNREQQRAEIHQNKDFLEDLLGRPMENFAYPYGYYSDESPKILQEAGFAGACTTHNDLTWPSADPYLLPRYTMFNWNGDEFARRIERWFDG